jgi:opacity protein-like surface antigen
MKSLLIFLVLTLTLPLSAYAAEFKTDLELSAGYRLDDLDWNIAGNVEGRNPNVLSEYTWSDVETFQTRGGLRVLMNDALCLRASFAYGWIFDGEIQDSDFAGNDRSQEFSRSNNSADDGSTLDGTIGIGYQFKAGRFRWIPMAGYSYSEQNLTLKDGFQSISLPVPGGTPPPVGPIAGLNSSYDTTWKGPWIGFDLFFQARERLILFGTFEFHWADYKAEANLNLRNDFAHSKSFEQAADGTGYTVIAGASYALKGPWSLALSCTYERWTTDAGIDRAYYVNGRIVETRLNEVNWDSFSIMLGLTYRFGF